MSFDNIDSWFNHTKVKTKKSKGAGGGYTATASRPVLKPKANTLKAVQATNKKLPQVMVKISGSSNGTDKAQAHVNYIGRKGDVEVENEAGEKYKGEDQKELLKSWEAMGMHSEDKTGGRKEAFHFVFSMPSGTNPDALKSAVRNLVNEEFAGHKFFMAQHLDTDSPHVHVLLAATDDRGARLNPRKADLHNYRVQFVNKLAEQGVEATASRRVHRFKYKEGLSQAQIHKSSREGNELIKKQPTREGKKKIEETHKEVEAKYKEYSNNLPLTEVQLKSEINKLIKSQEKGKEKVR